MNIVDLVVASIMIAIIVMASTSLAVFLKDGLIDSENYYEANNFTTAIMEELQPLSYRDDAWSLTPYPQHERPLPEGCKLRENYNGARHYEVGGGNEYWKDGDGSSVYKYVWVHTTWNYKGQFKQVVLFAVKRDEML